MTQPISLDNLVTCLEEETIWRLREISDLKAVIKRSDQSFQTSLLRSFIPIAYAHWEGFVRGCALKYFQHIVLKRKSYSELIPQFHLNFHLKSIDSFYNRKAGISSKCMFLSQVLSSQDMRFVKLDQKIVDTRSNLNFRVLQDICIICGLEGDGFDKYEDFLDKELLGRRNSIAHGEEVFLGIEDLDIVSSKTTEIMRLFRNKIENAAVQKSYLRK